jgi:hypothetical protein
MKMSNVFSIRGRIEALKYQFNNTNDMMQRTILNNVLSVYIELYAEYGIDVVYKIPKDTIFLNNFESQTFSQFNEDGITEKIFETIGFTNKIYLEFGGTANNNNTEILHKKYNFKGVLLNCDDTECDYTKIYTERVTAENIVDLCKKYEIPQEFDFLSIDIDHNDWYVFRAICSEYKPRVVVIEYNAHYPPPDDRVVIYDADIVPDITTYHGATIEAMFKLGRSLGYNLVAAESSGYNLFFVREDVDRGVFYGTNDTIKLYRTPKLGHRPCGEDETHTNECLKTYRLDGICGHKAPTDDVVWTNVQSLSV